jgi:hypothetical protein
MALEKDKKINQLIESIPEGVLVSGKWLVNEDFSYQLIKYYVDNNWLQALGQGVYCKIGLKPEWQGVVLGLQHFVDDQLHLGGISALNYQGLAHYLPMGVQTIHLFGKKFPGWIQKLEMKEKFECHNLNLFSGKLKDGLIEQPTKIRDWQMVMSSPERAILEVINEVKDSEESFVQAAELLEGLTVLRPILLQNLLESCKKIAVKRIFLFLAERSGHNWFKQLDINKIDLGTGKRQIISGGVLDKNYTITVPQSLIDKDKRVGLF